MSIEKHVAKRSLIAGGSAEPPPPSSPVAPAPAPFGRKPPPGGEIAGGVEVPAAVARAWAKLDREFKCGPIPQKVKGDLGRLLREDEALECVARFKDELKKAPGTDVARFIFNESRKVYYARARSRSSSRSPGAPRRKKPRAAAPAPAEEEAPAPPPDPDEKEKVDALLGD